MKPLDESRTVLRAGKASILKIKVFNKELKRQLGRLFIFGMKYQHKMADVVYTYIKVSGYICNIETIHSVTASAAHHHTVFLIS